MHDGMQYDLIQVQGHSLALECQKYGHFQTLSPLLFIMGLASDHGFLN